MAQTSTEVRCPNCGASFGFQHGDYLVINQKARIKNKAQFGCIFCSAEMIWEATKGIRIAKPEEVTQNVVKK